MRALEILVTSRIRTRVTLYRCLRNRLDRFILLMLSKHRVKIRNREHMRQQRKINKELKWVSMTAFKLCTLWMCCKAPRIIFFFYCSLHAKISKQGGQEIDVVTLSRLTSKITLIFIASVSQCYVQSTVSVEVE